MTVLKPILIAGLMIFTLSACGGGDSANGPSGNTPAEQIIGTWLSPCTSTHFDNGDPPEHFKVTLIFNADNSMKHIETFYQDSSCQNLLTAGVKNRETLGSYEVAANTTAADGGAATELNLLYGQVLENGIEVDPNMNKVVLSMFRISGNELTTSTLNPIFGFAVRSAIIFSTYPYTYQ